MAEQVVATTVLTCLKVIKPAEEALNDKGHKVLKCQKTFQMATTLYPMDKSPLQDIYIEE
ncbi:hypothetical protein F511_22607 [Dorcoceras hygrometricum]|uniref:Uncharacterized protein n=1 Tax=Dorcoceras hygrometricum TaxID=472368 RepID=A0A2Z7CGT5_9LAMI|nr:hypothetical protein F511_22607 [Dorcoceras hygrometricum]